MLPSTICGFSGDVQYIANKIDKFVEMEWNLQSIYLYYSIRANYFVIQFTIFFFMFKFESVNCLFFKFVSANISVINNYEWRYW